jgi:hypothetical protein
MATQIVGNTVTPFLPLDTDNSPLIGVITAVGGGNVTVEFQTAVDRQGDGGAPASLVVPSAQFDAWYDVELPVDIAPGALGTVAFGPYGKMLATVVKAFQLDIAEGGVDPITGDIVGSGRTYTLLYIEFCTVCNGKPSFQGDGIRMTVQRGAFEVTAAGPGINYARRDA